MIIYVNVLNGNRYRWRGSRVLALMSGEWVQSQHLRPADLSHFPFIGIKE
ncbi:hypothetical protein [Enterobacter phage EC152]